MASSRGLTDVEGATDGVLLPGEIAVSAGDPDDPRQLQVDVTAYLNEDTGNFTQSVTVPFEARTVRYLSMYLAGRCRIAENRMCPAGQVCGASGCAPVAGLITSAPVADAAVRARDVADVPCVRGAAERCNDGVDNNCDGVVDEGCPAQSCARDGGLNFDADVRWVTDAPERYTSQCSNELIAPTGAFTLGEIGDGGVSGGAVEGVTVAPFRIDRYEVTVARFQQYVRAGMPRPPYDRVQYPGGTLYLQDLRPNEARWPVEEPTAYPGQSRFCHWTTGGYPEFDERPLNCVDWFTAQAFCVWDGGRLPTEAEWEYVARYLPLPDAASRAAEVAPPRTFPWGSDGAAGELWNCDFNFTNSACPPRERDEVSYGTWRVTRTAHAQPWYRVFDLAGNVAEWTADVYAPYGVGCRNATASRANPLCAVSTEALRFAVRGGGYLSTRDEVRGAARASARYAEKARTLGFRCARAP